MTQTTRYVHIPESKPVKPDSVLRRSGRLSVFFFLLDNVSFRVQPFPLIYKLVKVLKVYSGDLMDKKNIGKIKAEIS